MPSPRANLAAAIAAVGVLALVPRPALTVVSYFHGPVTFLLSPVQQPVRSLFTWLRRSGSGADADGSQSPVVSQLQTNLEQARLELLQARQEVADLRTLVRDLSRGLELNPKLNLVQIPATVIGFGPDLTGGVLTVRAGTSDGVDTNAVVVVRGVHLVGRVTKADARTCSVLPITDPAFPKMYKNQKFTGVVMLDEQKRGPAWKLDSIQNGRLVGRVWDTKQNETVASAERPTITPDMLVRLDDEQWPANAQMLIIGRVVQVEPGTNDRPIVTIEPYQDVSRVSEVMIRVTDKPAAPASPADGKGKP